MDAEQGFYGSRWNKKASYTAVLSLAYQSFGVVYGDLSTSPLYVFKSTFSTDKLVRHPSEDEILGVLSFIFWTLTLIPLLKYVFIVLNFDDNGEGGTFALYSLLCRHAKLSLLPGQQQADEEVSTYKVEHSARTSQREAMIAFFEDHYRLRVGLLVIVLLGTCMVIGDGVLTPPISVLSAVSGINAHVTDNQHFQVGFTCLILVGLFSLQKYGTHRVAFVFAPVVILWLLSISFIGVYNVIYWNPSVLRALSPYYMYKFFRLTGTQGWLSFGGIALCLTGSEAMFADLGHFSPLSIKIAFTGGVYPCLVLAYMGQAAFLTKNQGDIHQSFYKSIPDSVYWPVVVVATLASIVASQSVISATFSIVNQCRALSCFPHVKVIHTSKVIAGQIYIPEINWLLMVLSIAVTVGFRDTSLIGNAYGLAVTIVMLVTTFLMSLVVVIVWRKGIFCAAVLLVFFGSVEGLYFSASLIKVPRGGWVPLALALIFLASMCVWHYGTSKKYEFDLQNKVSMQRILTLGPSLGLVRVPGIGLIYSNLVTGVPAVFAHFITNIPAFHRVLVFVCIKSVLVPYVPIDERFLLGRIGPKAYRMFRCIVRYGYKDVQNSEGFEDMLVASIQNFLRQEGGSGSGSSSTPISYSAGSSTTLSDAAKKIAVAREIMELAAGEAKKEVAEQEGGEDARRDDCSDEQQQLEMAMAELRQMQTPATCSWSGNESSLSSVAELGGIQEERTECGSSGGGGEAAWRRRRRVAQEQEPEEETEAAEVREVADAKAAGVAYLKGHSYVKAKPNSPLVKRLLIWAYSFLKQNCRGHSDALQIPHPSLIQVGMLYNL